MQISLGVCMAMRVILMELCGNAEGEAIRISLSCSRYVTINATRKHQYYALSSLSIGVLSTLTLFTRNSKLVYDDRVLLISLISVFYYVSFFRMAEKLPFEALLF